MEIEDPKTGVFVRLDCAFNFEYTRASGRALPDEFSFGIDWTKECVGQDILREHIRSRSSMRVRHRDKQYQGVFKHEWGFNTSDGMVFVEVA